MWFSYVQPLVPITFFLFFFFFPARVLIPQASFTSYSHLSSVLTTQCAVTSCLSWDCGTAVSCSHSAVSQSKYLLPLRTTNVWDWAWCRRKIFVTADVHVNAIVCCSDSQTSVSLHASRCVWGLRGNLLLSSQTNNMFFHRINCTIYKTYFKLLSRKTLFDKYWFLVAYDKLSWAQLQVDVPRTSAQEQMKWNGNTGNLGRAVLQCLRKCAELACKFFVGRGYSQINMVFT